MKIPTISEQQSHFVTNKLYILLVGLLVWTILFLLVLVLVLSIILQSIVNSLPSHIIRYGSILIPRLYLLQ